ncbi:MAG TPA: DUF523 domain-containing protein [Pseudobdellovibrionaceae bacterium]|nr:DUF523 domain-containing protein [Pseudobdellovibrionaceae bacterium]
MKLNQNENSNSTSSKTEKNKVIVSACLAGLECRFDYGSNERAHIKSMVEQGLAVPVCPEQLGGLTTPRPAAEQQGDQVFTKAGANVTSQFQKGAEQCYKVAEMIGAKEAYLKSRSPSCGCGTIYDGTFTKTLKSGDGVLTQLLKNKGIKVHSVD